MAKYTAAEIEAMGEKGHAFKNPDGSYSYPVGDVEDLKNAIQAVGRGNADHDAIRKYIIGRAKDLKQPDLIPDNWNADGSIESAAGHGLERRAEVRAALHNVRELRRCQNEFELRETPDGTGGTDLVYTGYASCTGDNATYEMEDWLGPWTESVSVGAFRKTLSDGADVAFLVNHEGLVLARTKPGTLKLSETMVGTPTGLHTEAHLDPKNPYVQALRSAVERGDIDEMSFAFRVTRQEWNDDYSRRWINEVNLNQGDVSAVNYGANPHTGGTVAIRSKKPTTLTTRQMVDAFAALTEDRAGKKHSASTVDTLNQLLSWASDIDTAADQMQPILATMLGVPNPDIAQDAAMDKTTGHPDEPNDDGSDDDQDQLAAPRLVALPDSTRQARAALARLRRPA